MKKLLFLACSILGSSLWAEPILIRLFSDMSPQQVKISVERGSYALMAMDASLRVVDTVAQAGKSSFVLSKSGNQVSAQQGSQALGVFAAYYFMATDTASSFKIEVNGKTRLYHGHLRLRVFNGYIQPVNVVEINQYVAGVVESEGGHVNAPEFFKAQAVLARTFALKNKRKHLDEGYNLKDDVTSQVYFSRPSKKYGNIIWKSVLATWDTILVDRSCEPILGVFHANSGGETVNVEDVWSRPLPYLKAHRDTFSLGQRSSVWEKTVPKNEFLQYLATKCGSSPGNLDFQKAVLNFKQENGRKNYFEFNGKQVNLRDVRSRFNLRSTYFSVYEKGDELLLKGRGYGHGVGLSQDGAIHMDALGKDFKEILQFYYRDVELENLRYRE